MRFSGLKIFNFLIFCCIICFLSRIPAYPGTGAAEYYEKLPEEKVKCTLCPNNCVLKPGDRGICRVRENRDGKLVTLVYNAVATANNDPIEKKPLYHFLPGTKTLSIATAGCNLRCLFCQNYTLSQASPEDLPEITVTSEELVQKTIQLKNQSISYTYNEPIIFYEFMYDTAKLAHKKGIKNIMVTAGYINPEPLRKLCKVIDAANVDLKGYDREYYEQVVGGDLETVKHTLKILKEEGVWIEITTLIVPGKNDDPAQIREMCKWIKEELGPEVPLHFSRFYPMYKMNNLEPTPNRTLEKMYDIAREQGLKYVYIGNVRGTDKSNTYCPECGNLLIRRYGYTVSVTGLDPDGKCSNCGRKIPGVWK